jgi:hypothetical protein
MSIFEDIDEPESRKKLKRAKDMLNGCTPFHYKVGLSRKAFKLLEGYYHRLEMYIYHFEKKDKIDLEAKTRIDSVAKEVEYFRKFFDLFNHFYSEASALDDLEKSKPLHGIIGSFDDRLQRRKEYPEDIDKNAFFPDWDS